MGLLPLEFTDGLTDSPYFRETLQAHERELDFTNSAIKHLIKDIKDLIAAARNLSRAQRTLSETLNNFNFECIGNSQTDDEMVIANSFKDFARLLSTIEDERDRLLEKADEAFLDPIERFRRDQITSAKEAKKKFDKETTKYCQNVERYLNLSIKKSEAQLREADANYSIEQWHFFKAMSEYVLKLQEVNERKKFEFVETVLSFMLGWLTFYHQGHEIATDFYSVKMELQMRLQRTRNNFNMTQEETKCLRLKMINNREKFRQKFQDSGSYNKMYTRQGYLFLMEKKAFSTSWTKHFCQYEKSSHRMTMIQYTQTMGKILSTEEILVKECIKRSADSIDRRFCFDIVTYPEDKSSNVSSNSGHNSGSLNGSALSASNSVSNGNGNDNSACVIYTFQALSEEDFKLWLDALDGRDPYPNSINTNVKPSKQLTGKFGDGSRTVPDAGLSTAPDSLYELDEEGYCFVKKCIKSIESHGLEQRGIYRIVGVTSKVRTLMDRFNDSRKQSRAKQKDNTSSTQSNADEMGEDVDLLPDLNLDSDEFETKTITSALKNYLRNLSEPIMTFQLHNSFIAAAKLENRASRIERIHMLVHRLPSLNFQVLKVLIEHLQKVSQLHDTNLMTSSNLGVCFGPTLLRTAEESVAAILDIKFVNVIAELLIENYEKIFFSKPAISQLSEDSSVTSQSICSQQGAFIKVNNCANSQMQQNMYETHPIQQRPLPHVPNSMSSHYGTRTFENANGKTTFYPIGPPYPLAAVRNNSSSQLMPDTYGSRQPFIGQNNEFRRSSSQDQLYSVIPNSISRNRPTFSSPNGPLGHLQHQHHLPYSAYTTHGQAPNSPRKIHHLALSSSSPSPSSTISTPAAFSSQLQNQPAHVQPIYQSPMMLKNSPHSAISPSSIYGQIRGAPLYSMSYQNLHYNSELANAANDLKATSHQANLTYNRPMTSIGIIPNSSAYAPIGRMEADLTKSEQVKMNFSNLPSPNHPQPQQSSTLAQINCRPPSNPSSLQPRSFNFSSSSSTSLPSTPEHSQPQFPYRVQQAIQSPVKKSMSPPSPITRNTMETSSDLSGADIYQMNYYPNSGQSIYGTVGHQAHRSPGVSLQQSPLPSTKVRTRYTCIGAGESELSFQPNMIITNVRNSREPGWLEGNLNGKTGLIPLNYVEFID